MVRGNLVRKELAHVLICTSPGMKTLRGKMTIGNYPVSGTLRCSHGAIPHPLSEPPLALASRATQHVLRRRCGWSAKFARISLGSG